MGFDAQSTVTSLKYALEALPPVEEVEVKRGGTTAEGGATFTVSFVRWKSGTPSDNNLYSHDGNPPLSFFKCVASAITGATQPFCSLEDTGPSVSEDIVEYAMCGNHGNCNKVTGECKCHRGFKGTACGNNADGDDHTIMHAEGPFFSGSIARLRAFREESRDFNFLTAESGDGRHLVTTIDGKGDVTLHEGDLAIAKGSVRLEQGKLEVQGGGVSVAGELSVTTSGGGGGGSGSSGGVVVALHGIAVDPALAALGLGVTDGELVGAAFDHGSLLTVSAPETTMAELGAAPFDFVTVGPQPPGASAATAEGAALRRGAAFLRVDHEGVTHLGGSRGGGLVVTGGDLTVEGAESATRLGGGLSVGGALAVDGAGGVEVDRGPLLVRDGNALIHSPSHSQPALAVAAAPTAGAPFSGAVLDLTIEGAGSSGGAFLRASRAAAAGSGDDAGSEMLFEVDGRGAVRAAGGVSVAAGGVKVESGGISVASGGVTVSGGIKLTSGTLDLASDEGLTVSKGGLMTNSASEGIPALTARAASPSFKGAVARLESAAFVDPDDAGSAGFNFLEAVLTGLEAPLLTIDDSGKLVAGGGVEAAGGALVAAGSLSVGGPAALGARQATVRAGDSIVVDPCRAATAASFVVIASDGARAKNVLSLPVSKVGVGSTTCVPSEGQLLLLFNGDEEGTVGAAELPPGKSVLFVFSAQAGPGWVPLTTLDSRTSKLEGITALKAAGNLDIGPFTLKAQQLVAGGQEAGQLALYGAGGLLVGEPALKFTGGLLSTPKINVQQVDSNGVDFMGTPLTNVRVESGSVSGLSTVRSKEVYVESLGASGQLLVVGSAGGQVAAAGDVYVGHFHKPLGAAAVANGKSKGPSTVVAPALRLSELAARAGSLALVASSGAIGARADVGLALRRADGAAGSAAGLVSPAEAVDLEARGVPTVAELRVPRVATGVFVGHTPVTVEVDGVQTASVKAEIRVEGDLVMNGRELRGATILDSSLQGLDELGVTWLTVRAAQGSSLAFFGANSTLQSLPGAVVGPGGVATFDALGVKALASDLDVAGHTLKNLKVSGGHLDNLDSVTTASLRVKDTAVVVAAAGAGKQPLALLSTGGLVEASPQGFAFDTDAKALLVPGLGAHSWKGAVDAGGHELRGAAIVGGTLSGVADVASDGGLSCKADLDVGEDAAVGGTLVVGGTVMGSGPYVDSSDARLKEQITDLFPAAGAGAGPHDAAVELVRRLRPVRYRFNASAAPQRKFPEGDEVGFLAHEVEALLPELVSTDRDGFKGVAYSRLTPVLAAAVGTLADSRDALAVENAGLQRRVAALEAAAAAAAAATAARAAERAAETAAMARTVAAVEAAFETAVEAAVARALAARTAA